MLTDASWWGVPLHPAAAAAMLCATPPLLALHWAWVTKWLIRAERHGFALCVRCGYPLVGLGASGECPECSQWFDAGAREQWRRAYDASSWVRVYRALRGRAPAHR